MKTVIFFFSTGLKTDKSASKIAEISVDGNVIKTVDLKSVTTPYDYTVENGSDINIVHIENDGVSVIEANCPDRVCVNTGKISGYGKPIVCLPHKVVVKIKEQDGKVDAVSGE